MIKEVYHMNKNFDDFTTQIQSDEIAAIIGYFENPRYLDEEK